MPGAASVSWHQGDLEQSSSLNDFLAPNGVLVHLAYPRDWNSTRHYELAAALSQAAARAHVRRVVLCSTAVVAGSVTSRRITADTVCRPVTEYEHTKLGIERTFAEIGKGRYELAVLRPTAVIGTGGHNLVKLSRDLLLGNRLLNYLRSSLYSRRRMNLVCVENVVAALLFLVRRQQKTSPEVFIVSDDDDPLNNFRDVELQLLKLFGVPDYMLPPLAVPAPILSAVLRLSGRSCTNPHRIYDGSALVHAGYAKESVIMQSLARFAASFSEK